jgi:uncharacterized repeat protein (TIGR01451 family)
VSWYSGQGNAQDGTGLNNSTAVGGVGYAPGVVGQAFVLDGSTGYLQTAPNPASLSINTAITVSAWVNPAVLKNDNVIIDKTQSGDAANYRFGIHGGQLFFWNGSQAVFSTATIPTNAWTQVAFTLDGLTNTLKFYINGVLDSTQTVGFGALNTASVLIGRDLPGRFFQGMLDEVTVYNHVLPAAQVGLLYNDPNGVTTDQRGYARLVGGAVDIGAAQLQYDLAISGSAPALVGAGNQVAYTLTVTNNGPDPVSGLTFADTLPDGVAFQSLTVPFGWAVGRPSGQVLSARTGGSLAPGSSLTFTVAGQVGPTTPGAVLTDTASIAPTGDDFNPGNNSVALSSMVPLMAAAGVDIHGQPANGVVGQPIGGPITVAVVDANGNTIPTSDQPVTLAIATGPGGAVLGGTTTVRAVHGVATFRDLTLNVAGTYTLKATGGNLAPDVSNPFTVAPADVTGDLHFRRGPLHPAGQGDHGTRPFSQQITITNTSDHALSGPLALVLKGLPAGATLANAGGTYQGNPYINVLGDGQVLAPGQSVTITLEFSVNSHHPGDHDDLDYDFDALLGI